MVLNFRIRVHKLIKSLLKIKAENDFYECQKSTLNVII